MRAGLRGNYWGGRVRLSFNQCHTCMLVVGVRCLMLIVPYSAIGDFSRVRWSSGTWNAGWRTLFLEAKDPVLIPYYQPDLRPATALGFGGVSILVLGRLSHSLGHGILKHVLVSFWASWCGSCPDQIWTASFLAWSCSSLHAAWFWQLPRLTWYGRTNQWKKESNE